MTMVDAATRVSQIRGQLGLDSTTSTNSASAAQFASQLASAQGSSTGSVTGADVVTDAKKYIGVPYVFGGTNPATGLDCSGLVQRVYSDLGIKLPRLAADQAKQGTAVNGLANAKPGDLLAFGSPVDHIAIYAGNNMMIAAPQPGENVKLQKVYETPTAIRRIVPETSTASVNTVAGIRPSSVGSTSLAGVPYSNLFTQAAQKYGVSATLLAAVAKTESGYNPNAVSPAGAQGLMQIMPATAKSLGVNPLDPTQAVDGAARMLKQQLKDFGSVPLALAAYNAGPGAVRKYGGIPPYQETQQYVVKVQNAMTALGGKA